MNEKDSKSFKCNYCGKAFKLSSYLSVHIKRVHSKTLICEFCDEVFNEKSSLNKHTSSVHVSNLRFTCNTCNYSSARKSNLNRHIRSGVCSNKACNVNNFKCAYCAQSFSYKRNLRRHETVKHKIHRFTKTKVKPNRKCPLCPFVSSESRKKEINEHFKIEHNLEIKWQKHSFQNIRAFYDWKNEIETKNNISFVKSKFRSNRSTRYFCHRSGRFKSVANKRRLKMIGSCKINAHCPCEIFVKFKEDGQIIVHYLPTHVGHENELEHLRLGAEERRGLAAKLLSKTPHSEILKGVRMSMSNNELKRIHLVNNKDLHNIKKQFNINKESENLSYHPVSVETVECLLQDTAMTSPLDHDYVQIDSDTEISSEAILAEINEDSDDKAGKKKKEIEKIFKMIMDETCTEEQVNFVLRSLKSMYQAVRAMSTTNALPLEVQETLDALKELSVFFTENTLQTRRSLRSKIEKRSLSINEDFLSAFRKVKDALDNIYLDVTDMNTAVNTMTSQLQATKAQTHQLIEHTTKLQTESQKLTMQLDVAKSFLKSFQLTPTELSALREANITDEFFTALDRVQTIHVNCRSLMQSGHQTSALDIMDQMAMYQETALERLYRWAQTHCRNMDAPGVGQLLTQAMTKLQDRPLLFKYVLTEYCTCRRAVLVHLFIDALTKGGPGGTPKPIEAHAHDTKRYVGDMLAWLHQAIPGERENLMALLKNCDTKTDVGEEVQQALSHISEGVCHPLQVRVDQILATDSSVVSLYHVSNLLRFYLQTFKQVVPGSSLEATLGELNANSEKAFLTTLQHQVKQQLLEKVDAPPSDLSPSPGIPPLLTLLKEIISIASVTEGRQEDINKVVSCVMDPLLQAITLSASRLAAIDMAVYLLNCLHLMVSTLALYEFMDERLERLKAQSDAQLDTLTSEQASSLVANLNLGPIYTILQDQGKRPLSQVPGMEPSNLNNFLGKLESLLNVPDMFGLPQMECLLSNTHRSVVQRRATQVITAIYTQLYNSVHNPDNLYANPDQLMPRTPDQVSAILLGS